MQKTKFVALARRLMRHPAAPYHEHAVREEVEAICRGAGLPFQCDAYGNVLVHLRTSRTVRPIVLAAHMDHPGFELVRRLPGRQWLARFQGGVPDAWFRSGTPVRLMPGGVPAKLGERKGKAKQYGLHAKTGSKFTPRFAVWELPDFTVKSERIHGRACDDLIGVAAILAVLIDLKRSRAKVNVIGVISRAEEVGFQGALCVAASRTLPRNSLVISLETSRELPGVKMGGGVILRVGDRTSIFDSAATRFVGEVAARLQKRKRRFSFQRALMAGGTCEATAYQEFGYQTAAVCVALGNYHNCGPQHRIAAEYINLADATDMVDLLCATATGLQDFGALVEEMPRKLRALLQEGQRRLKLSEGQTPEMP